VELFWVNFIIDLFRPLGWDWESSYLSKRTQFTSNYCLVDGSLLGHDLIKKMQSLAKPRPFYPRIIMNNESRVFDFMHSSTSTHL
jgi:hypothetical protein